MAASGQTTFSPEFWAVVAADAALLVPVIARLAMAKPLASRCVAVFFGAAVLMPSVVLAVGDDTTLLRAAGVALVVATWAIVAFALQLGLFAVDKPVASKKILV